MQKQEIRLKFCEILLRIGEDEKNIEILRQILCEQYFSPFECFQRIDMANAGFIMSVDILQFLAENGIFFEEDLCQFFINHYDLDGDNRLIYQEDMVMGRTLQERKPSLQKKKLLFDTEYALSRLIEREIQSYKNLELRKKHIFEDFPDFNLKEAYFAVNSHCREGIDLDSLDYFFHKNNLTIPEEILRALMRRLDRNEDGIIDFEEFRFALLPQQSQIKKDFKSSFDLKDLQTKKSTIKNTQSSISKFENEDSFEDYEHFSEKKSEIIEILLDEQGEFARTAKQLIILDKELEVIKRDLAMKPDFNLYESFRIFDNNEKGVITATQIKKVMNAIGLYPDKYDLYLFVRRFDLDFDGKLQFSEYINAFLPVKAEIASILNNKMPLGKNKNYSFKNLYCADTRKVFKNLLQIYMENESAAEALRQRLNHRKDFNLHKIFNSIDEDSDGFIDIDDMKLLFDNHGIDLTELDLQLLFERFDKNKDKKISYAEFMQELTPTSPKKYY